MMPPMDEQKKPFRFGEMEHIAHNRLADPEVRGVCENCWGGYPLRCKCGGWVHANLVVGPLVTVSEATPPEEPIVLEFGCDRCGKEYETTDR